MLPCCKVELLPTIANEYISNDCAYEGPSVEVTTHQVGYLVPSSDGICLCDDELTEHEVAIICGTYSIYTGTCTPPFNLYYSQSFFLAYKQEAMWLWFPPPSAC